MRTVTAAWLTAAANPATRSGVTAAQAPIWLIEILGVNISFATDRVSFSRLRTLGDGLILAAGTLLGDVLPAYSRDVAQGGLGGITVSASDDFARIQVGAMRVALLNQEGLYRTLRATVLDNAAIRVRLGFVGLGYDDYLEVWAGVIDRAEDLREVVILECIDRSFLAYPSLSVPLSPQYFPATPQANKSRSIPLLLGQNTDVDTLQVSGAVRGSLAFAMTSADTSLLLKDFGAPFPASGSIQVGTEVSITYAARILVTNPSNGLTSLQLAGLVRSGTPAAHTVGEAVVLAAVNYDYLIGYAVTELQAVRGNGTLISPGSYTLVTQDAGAPVSIVRFAGPPSEPVTVDVNAGSVNPTNLLTNGGFELGSLTGYTVGAGGVGAVGTVVPDPEEGAYWASIEGDIGAYKDLYQEVTTRVNGEYLLVFSHQDEDSNLFTNGGFEAGDLSNWTIVADPAIVTYFLGDGRQPFTYTFPLVGGITALARPADGRYALIVLPAVGSPYFEMALTIDAATTIGLSYTFSFAHMTQDIQYVVVGAGNAGPLFTRSNNYIEYDIGTTAAPSSITAGRRTGAANVLLNGHRFGNNTQSTTDPGGLAQYATAQETFVATATTTRFTLRPIGQGSPRPQGGGNFPPPPLLLDAVRLQNASLIDTANLRVQVGTPADPDAIVSVELAPVYVWRQERLRFRAIEPVTRITWQSRHSLAAVRVSYLDTMSLQQVFLSNENPIEQIRYMITTFLPTLAIDEASFLAAYDARILWRFGTVLFAPGGSRELLARMAAQCGCVLFESVNRTLKIFARDNARQAVFGFAQSNLVQESFAAVPESLEHVYTEIYVWFGAKTGGSMEASDFAASTYCTPVATTHPDTTLTILCDQALQTYKRAQRLDFYADFIQDIHTANLLLVHLVQTRTVRQTTISFQTWMDAAHLEIGDVIILEDPRYPGDADVFAYELLSLTAPTPTVPFVQLTARSLYPAGWVATWEYNAYAIETGGFFDDLEFS